MNFRSSATQRAVPSPESRPAAIQRALLLSKAMVEMATKMEKQFQGRKLSAILRTLRHLPPYFENIASLAFSFPARVDIDLYFIYVVTEMATEKKKPEIG